jgi:hypothetical protein
MEHGDSPCARCFVCPDDGSSHRVRPICRPNHKHGPSLLPTGHHHGALRAACRPAAGPLIACGQNRGLPRAGAGLSTSVQGPAQLTRRPSETPCSPSRCSHLHHSHSSLFSRGLLARLGRLTTKIRRPGDFCFLQARK